MSDRLFSGRILFIAVLLLFFSANCIIAQGSLGTEFFFCYPENLNGDYNGILIITAARTCSVTITNSDSSFYDALIVPADGVETVNIPHTYQINVSESIRNLGFRISATDSITVFFLSSELPVASNDLALFFPVPSVGSEYFVMGYKDNTITCGYASRPSQAAITAIHDSTVCEIIPSHALDGGHAAGVMFSVTLDAFESYLLRTSTPSISDVRDITGTYIRSSKPVAVVAGCNCSNVPNYVRYCDYLLEFMPPIDTWGKSFCLNPFVARGSWTGDVLRVLASEDGTHITVTDVDTTFTVELDRGGIWEWDGNCVASRMYARNNPAHEFPVTGFGCCEDESPKALRAMFDCPGLFLDSPTRIVSDKPIMIGQYMAGVELNDVNAGDPAFAIIPPDTQYSDRYIFLAPADYNYDYLNVAIPAGFESTLMLDGTPVTATWDSVPDSRYIATNILISDGAHIIEAAVPFLIIIYGFDHSRASYASVGGTNFRIVNPEFTMRKQCLTPEVESGTQATWRITIIQNRGWSTTGLIVSDSLPAGFTYTTSVPHTVELFGDAVRDMVINPSDGDYIVNWGAFSMNPGDSVVITFTANIERGVLGRYDNGVIIISTSGILGTNGGGLETISDDVNVVLTCSLDVVASADDYSVLRGDNTTLHANYTGAYGSVIFDWWSDPPGFSSNLQDPDTDPLLEDTWFYVVAEDAMDCNDFDSLFVEVRICTLRAWFDDYIALPGDPLTIPVWTDDPGSYGVDDLYMEVTYAHDILNITGIETAGSATEGWGSLDYSIPEPGMLIISGSSDEYLDSDSILCYINAQILPSALQGGYSPLNFLELSMVSEGIHTITENGIVLVDWLPIEWTADIRVSGNTSNEDVVLSFGTSRYGSNAYNPGLDLICLPSPSGDLPGYFPLSDSMYPHILKLCRDIRYHLDFPNCWLIQTVADGGTLFWNPEYLPDGIFTLNGYLDMLNADHYVFGPGEVVEICFNRITPEISQVSLDLGWNLISFYTIPMFEDVARVLPTMISELYWYDPISRAYVTSAGIQAGCGYWVYSIKDTVYDIGGIPVSDFQSILPQGWNLVGSVNSTVPVTYIAGRIIPPLYNWAPGYVDADMIVPGFGYWVLVASETCTLEASVTGGAAHFYKPLSSFEESKLLEMYGSYPPPPPSGRADAQTITPKKFSLRAYPNPFNASTKIIYQVPDEGKVSIEIYNLFGEKVSMLVDGFHQKGSYSVIWNGESYLNEQLSSGIYFVRLKTSRTSISEKLILLK